MEISKLNFGRNKVVSIWFSQETCFNLASESVKGKIEVSTIYGMPKVTKNN